MSKNAPDSSASGNIKCIILRVISREKVLNSKQKLNTVKESVGEQNANRRHEQASSLLDAEVEFIFKADYF